MEKNSLLNMIGSAVIISTIGVATIKSFQDSYNASKPGVVYYVNGKPAIERRFDTNEEFHNYLESERGKWETEYYSSLNKKSE
jgi:hypothetical protein